MVEVEALIYNKGPAFDEAKAAARTALLAHQQLLHSFDLVWHRHDDRYNQLNTVPIRIQWYTEEWIE